MYPIVVCCLLKREPARWWLLGAFLVTGFFSFCAGRDRFPAMKQKARKEGTRYWSIAPRDDGEELSSRVAIITAATAAYRLGPSAPPSHWTLLITGTRLLLSQTQVDEPNWNLRTLEGIFRQEKLVALCQRWITSQCKRRRSLNSAIFF